MKYTARAAFMALTICLSSACSEKAPEMPTAQEVEKIRKEADKKVQEANALRLEAEQGKSNMQNIAWGLGFVVIVALLIGVAIGSSSRKDAKDRK